MGKLSPRERKLLARACLDGGQLLLPFFALAFCALPLPGWPYFITGGTVANVLFLLPPYPSLAQITLAMVSNRFLISKSCLVIPWKIRVGASYPPLSLLPFEVSGHLVSIAGERCSLMGSYLWAPSKRQRTRPHLLTFPSHAMPSRLLSPLCPWI